MRWGIGVPGARWRWGALAAVLLVAGAALWANRLHVLPPEVSDEAERLAEVLEIRPGQTVGEIGAGRGELTVEMARRLGPSGVMYSTEIDPARLEDIRAAAARAGLANVRVVVAGASDTNLPAACCDAIFMRTVYHHITEPAAFNASLRRSVKPNGLFAVIDFEPGGWGLSGRPAGVPESRGGHGMPRRLLAEELGRAGFEAIRVIEDWGGDLYLMLFRAMP